MGKILEKLMKKYRKNVKNTGKVYEKILEKCKKNLEKSGKFVSPKKWEPWEGMRYIPQSFCGFPSRCRWYIIVSGSSSETAAF